MNRLEFPKSEDGHFYLPILISTNGNPIFIPRCFVDTGATKCVVPRLTNERTFHFPITGKDPDVGTGRGATVFDCITIPHISLMELDVKEGRLRFKETELQERDVPAWLADDDDFVIGMSLLSKFNVSMTKSGKIVIER